MIHYTATLIEDLADQLIQDLAQPGSDPFTKDLVITSSAGISRWLAQRLSLTLGSSGHQDGICAGVDFLTLGAFTAMMRPGKSPWSANALVPDLLTTVEALIDTEEFSQVKTHLKTSESRPRRRMSFVRLTASRFSSYVSWRPDMLRNWNQGHFVDWDGSMLSPAQLWQPLAWNALCDTRGLTPDQDCANICTAIEAAVFPYARTAVFCPDPITETEQRILACTAHQNPVNLYSRQSASPDNEDLHRVISRMSPLSACTATVLDELCEISVDLEPHKDPAPSLLHRIQQGIVSGQITTGDLDSSVVLCPTSGDQHVETLADLLIQCLNEDPSLEPREILVLVNHMDTMAETLEAFFYPDQSQDANPRHRIRASIAANKPGNQPAVDLLFFLITLVNGRATSEDLFRLARFPAVMNHFGFSESDIDKIATLISNSGIRWGVNPGHRANHNMDCFAQNTWMAGLGRMVLGVGLRE
ncbi:MAG: exodeoxyribonuclease V subunit gamma, partial [Propionibacteriaceae bacterium]|nr:exodeoxyribonuclease V subunit gamma [Propionibacteriaceae bacterium]